MKKIGLALLTVIGILLILGLINFLPMISLKTPGMKEYVVEGITLYANPKDAGETGRIGKRISESSARVTESLGNADGNNIGVIIYPDRGALKRKTLGFAGLLLPDWYIGKNTNDMVLITSPAEPGPAHSRESIEQAAVHEYVHVLTDRRHKAMGYWLKEGFALYLAEQRPEPGSVRQHSDITYQEFSTPNAIQFAQVGGYSLAYALMEYLEETYGWETILGFLTPGNGFEEVTGKTEKAVFEEWKSWLSEYNPS